MKLTLAGVFFLLPLSFASAQTVATAEPTARGFLDTAVESYELTPRQCAIYIEDGTLDVEVSGPGTTPDG
ncbi:hypothetical protein GI374_14720 [Paracoccus sp. S-4012]|uniref:hypothetical protein n=1 Tax=Paracoccus sp. S-4012 TaxID=2665648 RepID=UPI0012B0101C|nr:hypothetical protein [Paracoccus sp. S-4012]MRX51665.1 hypothetical protein [Paracoccus sp. S-4012]